MVLRANRVAFASALALVACGGEKRSAPATRGEDAGPTEAVTVDAAVADAAAVAPALEPLAAGTKVPGGMKIGARLVGGGRFVDAEGEKFVYLVERASRDRASVSMYAVHERGGGDDAKRLRELNDSAEACPGPTASAFVDGSLAVTDLDADGVGEVWLAWIVGCGSDEEPMVAKQVVLEGKDRYVIRGEAAFDGAADPDASSWPPGWHARALTAFDTVAAALVPAPAVAQLLTGDDFAMIEIEQEGEVPIRLSYPDLAPLPTALAAELTTRMKKFLRSEGDCHVGLVAPEVVSLSCRSGDRRATFTYWREARLPTIDPAELVGADRLKQLCGDDVRPQLLLDRDGLRWVPDANHAPPDACPDGIEWADMAPASARGRALVARHLAAVE
ncbi:MAG TPA: hypothetical protein VM261_16925 [Kofleriaceae bacterium]|nr:hypothetical protein [Kofleriaceae bacterium]